MRKKASPLLPPEEAKQGVESIASKQRELPQENNELLENQDAEYNMVLLSRSSPSLDSDDEDCD